MSNFIGDNINAIRIHKGLSQEQLAKAAGVSQTTISAWECGSSTPRKSNVYKLIEAIPSLDFDAVMSEDRGFAKRVLMKSSAHVSNDGYTDFPVYAAIAAGTPIDMTEIDNEFPVPHRIMDKHPNSGLVRVEGDSFNRRLPNGCYALIDFDQREPNEHDAFAVCVNGYAATIKRVKKLANGYELTPHSYDPTYLPIVYDYNRDDTDEVTIIGKVVWATMPFDYEI